MYKFSRVTFQSRSINVVKFKYCSDLHLDNMTMEAPPNEIEYLSKQIIINDKPVTYHTLAREQDIHVNHAKKILLEFYHKNQDKVKASFVITGTYEGKTLIKFAANESILQEWVNKYEKIHTIQIYSLSRSEVSGEELAMEDLKFPIVYEKVGQYVTNGMIKGPEFKMDVVEQKRDVVEHKIEAPKTVRDTKPTKTVKEEPKLVNAGLSSSYISRKAKPERTNTLSNYTSRKDENSKKRVQPTSTGYQYKSRKLETKAPKERVVIADANDDVVEEESRRPTKISTSELDKMFEDEFSDEEDTSGTPKETPQEKPKESEEEPKESNEEPQEISSKIPQDTNPEEPMFVEEEPPSPPPIVEDTIDEDGFITTYRKAPAASTKPVERKKPAPTSKPKTAINKKNDGKKMQSSLKDFLKPRKST